MPFHRPLGTGHRAQHTGSPGWASAVNMVGPVTLSSTPATLFLGATRLPHVRRSSRERVEPSNY
eukprot:364150-Chlamydomonas_euryale.AAC.3